MDNNETINLLNEFKNHVEEWNKIPKDSDAGKKARSFINQNIILVQREVTKAGCLHIVTISPPPAVGGMIMQDINPFDMIFESPYGQSMTGVIVDMIERTIGVLNGIGDTDEIDKNQSPGSDIEQNYAFVAMAIDSTIPELEDVLEAIKEAAKKNGIRAERVDDTQTNERITDRILESIKRSEFVIVDITYPRPNVFYEAGYAHGVGKTPVYVAKEGTKEVFDVKDYPIIYFKNMIQLKDGLDKRLKGLKSK
ncbi:MAG: hypothetical protein HQL75_08700 [Magnetococcales bacterium]|nr:hypothetical protein [Magnetococcales bacterium]